MTILKELPENSLRIPNEVLKNSLLKMTILKEFPEYSLKIPYKNSHDFENTYHTFEFSNSGSSINYVVSKSAIFDPSPLS